LSGEIANRSGDQGAAIQLWQQAHDIAAQSGMQFPQLRAAVSMAHAADGATDRQHAAMLLGKALAELEVDNQTASDAQALLRKMERQGREAI
jgi:hypothetical protein